MKKHTLIIAACLLAAQLIYAQSSVVVRQYIDRFKDAAIAEMQRTGVPAAITLAQGIHETSAGQSELVLASNNHFGIKCKGDWTGATVSHDDDAKGECFRKYDDPVQSYRDHSDFLKNRPYYAALFKLDPTDYEGWAYGLKKAGYATNPKYAQILIKIIRDYNLQDYTLIAMGKKAPGTSPDNNTVQANNRGNAVYASAARKNNYPSGVFKLNSTRAVFVPKGTSFIALAEQYGVSLPRLFDYNDMKPMDICPADELIFLEAKRKTGAVETHMVVAGETLWDIAQAEGIRMENMLAYNLLKENMQPESGQVVYLQKMAHVQPKLVKNQALQTASGSYVQAVATYLVHTVQAKETVYSIARKYEVSVDELLRWNNLATTDLNIGQELHINKRLTNATN